MIASEITKWSAFIRDNFDKLLLVFLFLCALSALLHLVHHNSDMEQVHWAREVVDTILGALLGLITGHALAQRSTVVTGTGTTATTEIKP